LVTSGVAAADPVRTEVETRRAAPPDVETKRAEVVCPAVDPGARRHDGFFARSDAGLAFLWANVSGSGAPPNRTGIRGLGQSASISIGGTPKPGLVVGGTMWTARIDPSFIENGKTVTPDDDSVKVTMLRVGPFLDWYPDPSRGFHAQLAAAFTAQVETNEKGDAIKPAAVGASLAVGAGHEWFILDEISIGLLGRVAFGRVVREPSHGEEHMLWLVPELAFTATYH
jgi:hypothetical protein